MTNEDYPGYVIPVNFDNDENEARRGMGGKRHRSSTCALLIALTCLTVVSLTLSLYLFTQRFLPSDSRSMAVAMRQDLKYEASSSALVNHTDEVARFTEEVETLKGAIHALVATVGTHNAQNMRAQARLDNRIKKVQQSLSQHLTKVSHNNASIERLFSRVNRLKVDFDQQQRKDNSNDEKLAAKLNDLSAQLDKKQAQLEGKLRAFYSDLNEHRSDYEIIKYKVARINSRLDDLDMSRSVRSRGRRQLASSAAMACVIVIMRVI